MGRPSKRTPETGAVIDGPVCALCGKPQIQVFYDGVDMPIGRCCILAALNDADDELEAISVEELLRRIGFRP